MFAGLIEDLKEFAGEVRALIVGIACHPADLAVGPIGGVRLLSTVIPRDVLVIHFLLEFAIGANGAHLGRFVGSVVVGFNSSGHSVFLHHRVLGHSGGRAAGQQRRQREHVRKSRNGRVVILWQERYP